MLWLQTKKGIRSRDARRVPFASLTTPLFARQSRDDLLGWRLVATRCARVLIAFGSLLRPLARPPSFTYVDPCGVPWGRCCFRGRRCSALARLRPVPGRLLACSHPLVPLRPVGLVRAPGARGDDGGDRDRPAYPRPAPRAGVCHQRASEPVADPLARLFVHPGPMMAIPRPRGDGSQLRGRAAEHRNLASAGSAVELCGGVPHLLAGTGCHYDVTAAPCGAWRTAEHSSTSARCTLAGRLLNHLNGSRIGVRAAASAAAPGGCLESATVAPGVRRAGADDTTLRTIAGPAKSAAPDSTATAAVERN